MQKNSEYFEGYKQGYREGVLVMFLPALFVFVSMVLFLYL
jgi:hypothetical protein